MKIFEQKEKISQKTAFPIHNKQDLLTKNKNSVSINLVDEEKNNDSNDEPEEVFFADELLEEPDLFHIEEQPSLSNGGFEYSDKKIEDTINSEFFYNRYLYKETIFRQQWKQALLEMSTAELFEIIKNRYKDNVDTELSAYGEILKDEICSYAKNEIIKRAKINQNKKSQYHVFGELICKSFNQNNKFPYFKYSNSRSTKICNLVSWIRERYTYLYANLSEDDFKTECQAGLDMINIDEKLEKKLKHDYPSLKKKVEKHVQVKNKKIENKMIQLLNEILEVPYTYTESTPEEKENAINKKYADQDIFLK